MAICRRIPSVSWFDGEIHDASAFVRVARLVCVLSASLQRCIALPAAVAAYSGLHTEICDIIRCLISPAESGMNAASCCSTVVPRHQTPHRGRTAKSWSGPGLSSQEAFTNCQLHLDHCLVSVEPRNICLADIGSEGTEAIQPIDSRAQKSIESASTQPQIWSQIE